MKTEEHACIDFTNILHALTVESVIMDAIDCSSD